MSDTTANEKLKQFLRSLADSIESNEIREVQLSRIGEFFMSYQFQEQALVDNQSEDENDITYSREELIKFLSMGWYIYQLIQKDKIIPVPPEE
jgi:hypothetical protein